MIRKDIHFSGILINMDRLLLVVMMAHSHFGISLLNHKAIKFLLFVISISTRHKLKMLVITISMTVSFHHAMIVEKWYFGIQEISNLFTITKHKMESSIHVNFLL